MAESSYSNVLPILLVATVAFGMPIRRADAPSAGDPLVASHASQLANQPGVGCRPGGPPPECLQPGSGRLVAFAQTPEWPILSLRVEGLSNSSEAAVLAAAGLKTGELASKARFEAAYARLVASGFFEQVSYRFTPVAGARGYAAVFQVVEVQPVCPVRFEDLPASAAELQAALRRSDPLFTENVPGTEQILKRYVKVVEAQLAASGHTEQVAAKVANDDSGQLIILFRPAKMPPSVAEVHFVGNKLFPETTLQNAVSGVAIGSVYHENRFRLQIELALRPLYEGKGYVRVAFPKIEVKPVQDVEGLSATVTVEEGAAYKLDAVEIAGAPLDPARLLKTGAFKGGEVFDLAAAEQGRERVLKAIHKDGYIRAKLSFERKIDDAKKTIALTLRVEPGAQYLFGRLLIQGLDIQSEPVIRKAWALKEGKPFNADYPVLFLQRVREGDIFENLGELNSVVKADDQERRVDVTLVFGAAPPVTKKPKRPDPDEPPQ